MDDTKNDDLISELLNAKSLDDFYQIAQKSLPKEALEIKPMSKDEKIKDMKKATDLWNSIIFLSDFEFQLPEGRTTLYDFENLIMKHFKREDVSFILTSLFQMRHVFQNFNIPISEN